MSNYRGQFADFMHEESGASAAEYAILLTVVTLVASGVLALGDALENRLSDAAGCVEAGCL